MGSAHHRDASVVFEESLREGILCGLLSKPQEGVRVESEVESPEGDGPSQLTRDWVLRREGHLRGDYIEILILYITYNKIKYNKII
jgi:hypothetical protein